MLLAPAAAGRMGWRVVLWGVGGVAGWVWRAMWFIG